MTEEIWQKTIHPLLPLWSPAEVELLIHWLCKLWHHNPQPEKKKKKSLKLVFCFQKCSALLYCEKTNSSGQEYLLKFKQQNLDLRNCDLKKNLHLSGVFSALRNRPGSLTPSAPLVLSIDTCFICITKW